MHYITAEVALIVWPFITFFLFFKLDTVYATCVSIVVGYLFLPLRVNFNIPFFPQLGKNEVICLSVIASIIFVKKIKIINLRKNRRFNTSLILLIVIPFINFIFNTKPIFNGEIWLPGLGLHEAVSAVIFSSIYLLPILIAANIFHSESDIQKLAKVVFISSLIYLPLVFFELRFSPQLHNYLYGFHPHSFKQQIREGGFRSTVFLGHGLLTANFYLISALFGLYLYKSKSYIINKQLHLSLLLFLVPVILLLKSYTALALISLAFILYLIPSLTVTKYIITAIGSIILLYPLFTYSSLIPYDFAFEIINNYNPDRAGSLWFRFYNEDVLIKYLDSNFLIGNGGSGRAMISGSIVDGTWIIWTTRFGYFFFLVYFYTIISPAFKLKISNKKEAILTIALICILIDQIPNSSMMQACILFIASAISIVLYREIQNEKS